MSEHLSPSIGPYQDGDVVFRDGDPRTAEVAQQVGDLIAWRLQCGRVEHIGSTAVGGAGGTGTVDLLVPAVSNVEVEVALVELGFQRATTEDEFFAKYPFFVGSFSYDGEPFALHVHLIPPEAEEIDAIKFFRTCLRADSELLRAYLTAKRAILADGVICPAEYQRRKAEFFKQVLG